MGYRFAGFFVDTADSELTASARGLWPLICAQPISSPFVGYGFRFPDHERSESDEDAEYILNQRYNAHDTLPLLSSKYPEVLFLWIEADCAGGVCLYSGYLCRRGQVLLSEDVPATNSLGKLLEAFGVAAGVDQYFQPFSRGFSWY